MIELSTHFVPVQTPKLIRGFVRTTSFNQFAYIRAVLNDFSQQSSVSAMMSSVNTRLRHTATKERQCRKHHALKDQAQPCGYHTRLELPDATLNNIVSYQYKRALTQTASFRPCIIFLWNRLPQLIVEQSSLEGFQSALGQTRGIY